MAGGTGNGVLPNQFSYPWGVYVTGNGVIYVADRINYRVQKFTPGTINGLKVAGGNGQDSAAYQLDYPNGIHVDDFGNIYVSDNGINRKQKWLVGASSGITVAGGNEQGSAPTNHFTPAKG